MAERLTQFAYVEGLDTLKRLLDPPDELIAAPWKTAVTDLVEEGAKTGRSAAPYKGGQTRKRIFAKVAKGSLPLWAAVRSRGVRKSRKYPRGFSYPRLLNYSQKHGHSGWFDRGAIEPVVAKADAALNEAANLIAMKWGRY